MSIAASPKNNQDTSKCATRVARTQTLTGFQILGTGSYLPENVVTNEELHERYGFDPKWISQRTGIHERRYAQDHEATSDLCYEAALKAMEDAGVGPEDIDLLILATFTPDMSFPATACMVQERLGLLCGAFDLQAACAGFLYGLVVGAQFIKTGTSKCCLVIGGDANSRVINPKDHKSHPLFGDGAGAVVLGPGSDTQGFLSYQIGSDGTGSGYLSRPGCGSRLPASPEVLDSNLQYLQMDGPAVFHWAVNLVTESTTEILNYANLEAKDLALLVPHQANIRIINAIGDVLGFDREQVVVNIDRYGNTSAGSIPIALDEAIHHGRIEPGDKILLTGYGAGLTWCSAVFSY